MVKILSQSGSSLADIYDVEGSIAGIEQLQTREVPIFHEMGGTIFSERFRTTFRNVDSGAIAQSVNFDLVITNLPPSICRLLGIVVTVDNVARVSRAAVSIRDPISGGGQEVPIWVWDETNDIPVRFIDEGATVVPSLLVGSPSMTFLPTFIGGSDQGAFPMNELVLRGTTAAFGAGTVTVRGIFHFAFTFTGGVSSHGLPVPSW